MLRTDVIEVINSGKAWAFIGSGVSSACGLPTWKTLVADVEHSLEEEVRIKLSRDHLYQDALRAPAYAKCLSRMVHFSSRKTIESALRTLIDQVVPDTKLIKTLVDWPFAAMLTTNYDSLLESALRALGHNGWLSLSNSTADTQMISGDADQLVWHIHGQLDTPRSDSRLIFTEDDYDEIYLHNSPILSQLRAVLLQRRIVFIGFGLQDPEVMRVLKSVGSLCNPARPALAIMRDPGDRGVVDMFLKSYNVDIIPYRDIGGGHADFDNLIMTYDAMILKRSLTYGQQPRACPEFSPDTTGLLTYNQLVLAGHAEVTGHVLETMLQASILARLQYAGTQTESEIVQQFGEKTQLLGEGSSSSRSNGRERVAAAVQILRKQEYVSEHFGTLRLTEKGTSVVQDHKGAAELLENQFSQSLLDRAVRALGEDGGAAERVRDAAETFFKEAINRRALGLALSTTSAKTDFRSYHAVALLQSLPEVFPQLHTEGEGRALIGIVQDVLSQATDREERFIGTSLQAAFGLNLLGYSEDAFRVRLEDLRRTVFLLDSSTLIPLLARSGYGHEVTKDLVRVLLGLGCQIATTELFVVETAEHGRYALRQLRAGTTLFDTYEGVLERSRYGSNVFINGFFEEVARGDVPLDVQVYLSSALRTAGGDVVAEETYVEALEGLGVESVSFEAWEGFGQELFSEKLSVAQQIEAERRERGTFRHERQVQAEAEALLIIEGIRAGRLKRGSEEAHDAYFVSNTGIIDRIAGGARPITIRAEALRLWLSTLVPTTPQERAGIARGLQYELADRGFVVVDARKLQAVFGGLISGAKERLGEVLEAHRGFIARRYGESQVNAFQDVRDVDIPIVVRGIEEQVINELERKLEVEKEARLRDGKRSQLDEKERSELARLRERERERRRRGKARAVSGKTKSKKRRKKKRNRMGKGRNRG